MSGIPGSAAELVKLASPAPGVDVWMCALERSEREIEHLAQDLSAAEIARAARFGTPALRARYIAGRASLRALLGARLGIGAGSVSIVRGVRGRPFVDVAVDLDFNVSHTAGTALFAITSGQRIGVDIEHRERRLNVDGVARKFMAVREQAMLAGLDPDARRRTLLRLWTCKEAMSKATGDALSAPFRRMEVEIEPALRLAAGPQPYEAARWRLCPVAAPPDFLATVALWRGA